MVKNKVLIIRFSSFGDIVQCSSVVELIRQKFTSPKSQCEIHWATRQEFDSLIKLNPGVDQVWVINKMKGVLGLIKFALHLRSMNFSHIYDAHNNLRSSVLKIFLMTKFHRPKWITRPKDRMKRFLLFKFRINKFPKPFIGILSYISPLSKWGIEYKADSHFSKWIFPTEVEARIETIIKVPNIISLVPSAAWEMKRWPLEHWKSLIKILPEFNFVILGGKEDIFCQDIADVNPEKALNFAGKLSLVESCALIQKSALVISADTGLLHVADVLGKHSLSLMGPSAFGFTLSSKIKTLEVKLACRPCSKDGSGTCSQEVWQKCMVDITPASVASEVRYLLH